MAGRTRKRDRRPTIIDVAKAASVGIMTVSRVLNNHPAVKAATRKKVMSAIARVGYVQNDAARILKGGRARTIGLIVPDLTDFFASCFHAVQEVAMRHDYQTLVVATGRSGEIENEQLDSMNARRVSGLVLVTTGGDPRRVQNLLDSGVPVVAIDRPIPGIDVDAFVVENREGAECATRHLIQHGHKRIACVGSESGSFTARERFEGYRKAMRDAGLKPLVFNKISSRERMDALVEGWKSERGRPTAVFSVKRITSIQLIQSLHRNRVRVPQELAVVGFDDFELAEVIGTPLTVVSQSPHDIARAAAEVLFQQIAGLSQSQAGNHIAVKTVFPTKLIVRASCGCREA